MMANEYCNDDDVIIDNNKEKFEWSSLGNHLYSQMDNSAASSISI